MTEEQLRRFEERLERYAKNLIDNGHPEAAAAVEAVREAFSQEIIAELLQK